MEGPAPCVVCAVAADLAALDRPASDGAASSQLAARRRFLHEDFAGDGQHDVAEAMRRFLERCVEADVRTGGRIPPPLLLDVEADSIVAGDSIPMGMLIGGDLHCQHCDRRWRAPSQALPLLPLHLAQWRGVGVEAALRHHFGVSFDLDAAFACSAADGGCGVRGQCRGRRAVLRWPPVLALQLCRFNARLQRDDSPATLPEELDVGEGRCYTLRAVVEHRGSTVATGHYVAFTRADSAGPWLLHDDARDTAVPGGSAAQVLQAAYLCFYVRTT